MDDDPGLQNLIALEKEAAGAEEEALRVQEESLRAQKASLDRDTRALEARLQAAEDQATAELQAELDHRRTLELQALNQTLENEPTDFPALGQTAWKLMKGLPS